MSLTANLNRDSKAKPEPFTALEFMNFMPEEPKRELTPEEFQEQCDKALGL